MIISPWTCRHFTIICCWTCGKPLGTHSWQQVQEISSFHTIYMLTEERSGRRSWKGATGGAVIYHDLPIFRIKRFCMAENGWWLMYRKFCVHFSQAASACVGDWRALTWSVLVRKGPVGEGPTVLGWLMERSDRDQASLAHTDCTVYDVRFCWYTHTYIYINIYIHIYICIIIICIHDISWYTDIHVVCCGILDCWIACACLRLPVPAWGLTGEVAGGLRRLFIPILTLDGVEGSYPEMPLDPTGTGWQPWFQAVNIWKTSQTWWLLVGLLGVMMGHAASASICTISFQALIFWMIYSRRKL